MDYSEEFSLKFEITLDRIQRMNKEQLFCYKRGLATQMFFISRSLPYTCAFRKDSEQRRKQLDLGYQPEYQHICKVTGPLGNIPCYFKHGKPKVLQCVFLLLFNFSLQKHNDTPINSFIVHIDTAGNQKKKLPNVLVVKNVKKDIKKHSKAFQINVR